MHLQARVIKANHNIRAQSLVVSDVDANSLSSSPGSLSGGGSTGGHLGANAALSASHSSLAHTTASTTSAVVYDVMAHLRDMVVSHPHSLSACALGSGSGLFKQTGSAMPLAGSGSFEDAHAFHTQSATTAFVVPAAGCRLVLEGASLDVSPGVMRTPDIVGLEVVAGDVLETSLAKMNLSPTSRIFYLSPRDRSAGPFCCGVVD
jgi:hypothetical protein